MKSPKGMNGKAGRRRSIWLAGEQGIVTDQGIARVDLDEPTPQARDEREDDLAFRLAYGRSLSHDDLDGLVRSTFSPVRSRAIQVRQVSAHDRTIKVRQSKSEQAVGESTARWYS